MRPRGRMTFCKALYGKGGQFGSIIKTENLNDSLQSLKRFELSPNTSSSLLQLTISSRALFQADIASSSTWSSLVFHLFHSLLNPSGGTMNQLKTTWAPKFPVSPSVCFCSSWNCFGEPCRFVKAFCRKPCRHFREGARGTEEVWSEEQSGFPCAPQHGPDAVPSGTCLDGGRFGQNPKSQHVLWSLVSHKLPWPSQMSPGTTTTLSECSQLQTAHAALPTVWKKPGLNFLRCAQQQNFSALPHKAVYCSIKYKSCFISAPKLLKLTPNPTESNSWGSSRIPNFHCCQNICSFITWRFCKLAHHNIKNLIA